MIQKIVLLVCLFTVILLPEQLLAQRKMEDLGRGTVAVKKSNSAVFISWRILGSEFDKGTTYNLYRDGNLIATELTVSNYTDATSILGSYQVAAVIDGVEKKLSPETEVLSKQVLEIPIENIGNYYVHLAWVGDLDGDGEFEIVVDRIPLTESPTCKLEAYKFDGTRLWQVDFGPLSVNRNGIEGGAAVISNGMWDGVTVYDLDSDGKAEVIVKSANGTQFGDGTTLEYNSSVQNFLSVLEGETGAEKARIALPDDYLVHGPLQSQLTIGYLDGIHPSVIVKSKNRRDDKGFNLVVAAYDYRNEQLTQRWKFKPSGRPTPEFHQLRVADVDQDGKDEFIDGGYVLDDDGTMLYTLGEQGVVHGDRFHIGDFDPDRPGLEGYAIQQDNANGLAWYYYDAKDGTFLQTQYQSYIGDYARGSVADIDPTHPGYEMWTFTDGIYNVQDGKITDRITDSYPNFRLWWDGDVVSEMLDGVKFNKWNYTTNYEERMLTASDFGAVDTWRAAPLLYGDLFGDWREEVVFERGDHSSILIFTTTLPTDERIYTLLHNSEYRLGVATKGYLQSHHVDFFLGNDMNTPPIPFMQKATATWTGATSLNWNQTEENWETNNETGRYTSADTVLFGLLGEGKTEVVVNGTVNPGLTYLLSPVDYSFSGNGSIESGSNLIKSGYSAARLNVRSEFDAVKVQQGELVVNDTITASSVEVYGNAVLGGNGVVNSPCTFQKRSVVAAGDLDSLGVLKFSQALKTTAGMTFRFRLDTAFNAVGLKNDQIMITGDLSLDEEVVFEFQPITEKVKAGDYPLMSYTGTLKGDLSCIDIEGLFGERYQLMEAERTIVLRIEHTRSAASITWAGADSVWDLQNVKGWKYENNLTEFVAGDSVIFNETGLKNTTVNIVGDLPVGYIEINGDDSNYLFTGSGVIGGTGDLVKNGRGEVNMEVGANSYTGMTVINGGKLIVTKLDVAGNPSSIGANTSTSSSQLVVNDATLSYQSGNDSYTDKGFTLNGSNDTIDVAKLIATVSVSGKISGSGQMVKTGHGTLYLIGNSNSYSGGTVIESGTIQLNDPGSGRDIGALGSGPVIFKGGKLKMGNTRDYTDCSLDFHVPLGSRGTLYGDMRCNYDGKLTGEGTLTVVLPGDIDRTIFRGDWSQFKGTVAVSGASPMRLSGSKGYHNMRFDLDKEMSMYFSTGTSSGDNSHTAVHIGSITGDESSVLFGEKWYIGATNDTVTFDGKIEGYSLTKEGEGMLTLTNNNTYSGGTSIQSGVLYANNSSGRALGTGNVTVEGGRLDGSGKINPNVTVKNGGGLGVANEKIGTLTFGKNVTLEAGAYFYAHVNSMVSSADKIVVSGSQLNLDGTLVLANIAPTDFVKGNAFHLLEAETINGEFENIVPEVPGEGLMWDTSALYTDGVLAIANAVSVNELNACSFKVYPNPVRDLLHYQLQEVKQVLEVKVLSIYGQVLIHQQDNRGTIDLTGLSDGIYFVEFTTTAGRSTQKVIKQSIQ